MSFMSDIRDRIQDNVKNAVDDGVILKETLYRLRHKEGEAMYLCIPDDKDNPLYVNVSRPDCKFTLPDMSNKHIAQDITMHTDRKYDAYRENSKEKHFKMSAKEISKIYDKLQASNENEKYADSKFATLSVIGQTSIRPIERKTNFGTKDMVQLQIPLKNGDDVGVCVIDLDKELASKIIRPQVPLYDMDNECGFRNICKESDNGVYFVELGDIKDKYSVFDGEKSVEMTAGEIRDKVKAARDFYKERNKAREAQADSLSADVKSNENEAQATVG